MSASPDQKPHGSVRIEDGMLVIRMPLAEAHEPPRVCRRLIDVSYAAITSVSRAA